MTLLFQSCTKDFENINTNPISYTEDNFDPNFLLSNLQLSYAGSNDFAYDTWRANLIYSGTMMQGLSSVISYWSGDKYILNLPYTSAYWEKAYGDQVKLVSELSEFTKEKDQYRNVHQVSRIMKALVFQRLTDLYGDIPYSEAGLGYRQEVFYPKYDSQDSIYADMLKELEEAVIALDPAADAVSGDMFYQGNVAQWQKFGYTLMLRMAMRLTKVNATLAQEYATKALGKTMQNNDDNAMVAHDDAGGRVTQNRIAQVFLDGGQEHYYVKWSDTFIDKLKANNDPRIAVAVTNLYPLNAQGGIPASGSQNANFNRNAASQKGMPNGRDLSGIAGRDISSHPSYTTISDYSGPHPLMISRTAPTFLLTYSESELLLAEANVRWGIGESAATHYRNAIVASATNLANFGTALNISASAANTFAEANPLVVGRELEQIATEYWLHNTTVFNYYEVWSNWRRTGLPALTPVNYVNNATQGRIPRRFPYPIAEESTNPQHYRAASAAVPGGDILMGRVWWDTE
ncbi:SusD/RagB family nutrient-binding outer membrane lipoprotein [Sphingobacterium corticis]|uniref:SusD/RagB family nutrient-binding outer membrane lipoprotein n=1 Tax=Sphingobacterium corticis TaxID=1812823 RepID=A0ABW5NHV6_9SPHI